MRLTMDDIFQALGYDRPLAPHSGGTGEALTPGPSPKNGRGVEDPADGPAPPLSGVGGTSLVFTGVSTDTRTLRPGDLFVALRSEKANGHDYVSQAVQKGAIGLVVSQNVPVSRDIAAFRVPDTEVAYGLIARFWRDQFDVPVVGVTGSVGKTTAKEMLAAALSPLGPVLKTEASQNGETGVPKTLLGLTDEHKTAVIEMGMRGRGQIDYLCGIARPTAGVITLISDNHIELLGSRDAIADVKGELIEALPPDGLAVLNADDPYLDRLRAKSRERVVTYGFAPEADYQATDAERTDAGWRFAVRGATVDLPSLSRHDISNALAALAVAGELGVALPDAAVALGRYASPPGRMQVVQTPWGGTVLDDAFNAAPASMASALETLTSYGAGRKVAFLGVMRELGDHADAAHRALGEVVARLGGLDALYTVGGLAALIPGAAMRFPDSEAAAGFARHSSDFRPDDVVLVKGSHAVAMEVIVEALKARGSGGGG